MHCFEVLDVLYRVLEASPVAWTYRRVIVSDYGTSSMPRERIYIAILGQTISNFFPFLPSNLLIRILIDLKCWIRIRSETNADLQQWVSPKTPPHPLPPRASHLNQQTKKLWKTLDENWIVQGERSRKEIMRQYTVNKTMMQKMMRKSSKFLLKYCEHEFRVLCK